MKEQRITRHHRSFFTQILLVDPAWTPLQLLHYTTQIMNI
jgi:hypothetical protein